MKSTNHAIIMLKLGQQIQKEQEGNTAMIQLHETETKAIRQAKEESRAKIALCYMVPACYIKFVHLSWIDHNHKRNSDLFISQLKSFQNL